MSAGSAKWSSGMSCFRDSAYGPESGVMSVAVGPGCTLLTVMPCGPSSRARPRVRPATANDRGTDAPGPARDQGGFAVERAYAGLGGAGGGLGAHKGVSDFFNTSLTNRTARLL